MASLSTRHDISWALVVTSSLMVAVMGAVGFIGAKKVFTGSPSYVGLPAAPETVVIEPRTFSYRAAGDYYKNGFAVDGPMRTVTMTGALTIMKHQVSSADYALCVEDGACAPAEPEYPAAASVDRPVTGVSLDDAKGYAAWLSERTGDVWQLPTDEELAFAAGSRFPDDALGVDPNSANPADRWLADYYREAKRKASREPIPQPFGRLGENEFGLSDFGGNIWEWTTTCSRRVDVDRLGVPDAVDANACGIYHAIGKHRAPMVFFVRNPKGGGCAVGTPPDNLGFRLVKDTRWYAPLIAHLRARGLTF